MSFRRLRAAALISTMALAAGISSTQAQPYGAQVAKPYTAQDVAYGRILQAKIDSARSVTLGDIGKLPAEPFHVVGDLYFVGVHNFGSYLIRTPEGLILIDSTWADTAPLVAASIEKLGFKLTDIKYILATEGSHGDHSGGMQWMKAKTGAQLWIMTGDAQILEKGNGPGLPAAHVDRILRDRDQLKFGGKTLTAYHIPGHTPGSATWFWQETQDGVTYNVADVCCWFTPDNVVSNPEYSLAQLRRNWEVLKSLPVDIPTPGIHTYHFDMWGKLGRLKAGEKMPWIDPKGYRGVIAAFDQDFEDKVRQQQRDGPPPPRQRPAAAPPAR